MYHLIAAFLIGLAVALLLTALIGYTSHPYGLEPKKKDKPKP